MPNKDFSFQKLMKHDHQIHSSLLILFVMKMFPFSISDFPQSKYYVHLELNSPSTSCKHQTYWKYGGIIYSTWNDLF